MLTSKRVCASPLPLFSGTVRQLAIFATPFLQPRVHPSTFEGGHFPGSGRLVDNNCSRVVIREFLNATVVSSDRFSLVDSFGIFSTPSSSIR